MTLDFSSRSGLVGFDCMFEPFYSSASFGEDFSIAGAYVPLLFGLDIMN